MVELGPVTYVPYDLFPRLKAKAEAYRRLQAIPHVKRMRIRESAGISLETMAEACGVHEKVIERYELDYTPTEDEAVRYWFALNALIHEAEENLTEEERRNVVALFEAGEQCRHCGGMHSRSCPRVRTLQYHPSDGSLAKVEFWEDSAWPKDNIIFKDSPQLAEPEDTY